MESVENNGRMKLYKCGFAVRMVGHIDTIFEEFASSKLTGKLSFALK